MRARKGRRVAIATGLLVVATLAGTAILARGAIVERWYIHRLHSDDEATRIAAAWKLADLNSLAAVPYLIQAVKGENRRQFFMNWNPDDSTCRLPPFSYCLFRIGVSSPGLVKKMIREEIEKEEDGDGNWIELAGILHALDQPPENVQQTPLWSCTR
jgi:hypothetical protein